MAEVDHGILSSGAAPVELVPVPASVFDDDFFKAALPARFSDAPKVEAPVQEAETRPISAAYVQSEEVVEVTMRSPVVSNAGSYGGSGDDGTAGDGRGLLRAERGWRGSWRSRMSLIFQRFCGAATLK